MKIIPTSITTSLSNQILTTKANSPHIFFAAGVIGAVGATFLACRATLKLEDTLEDITSEIKEVKDASNIAQTSDADHMKDMVYVYGKGAAKLVRLYGPSVVLGGLAIASLTGSHVQLTRRNTALAATVTGLSKAFDEYRVKIQDELGVERERDIYLGLRDEEITNEDGKKETVKVIGDRSYSIYSRWFEESNKNWEPSHDHNRTFLQLQQNYFNHRLQAYGHVFLNEVYDKLGLERSTAGQIVGWMKDGEGDGHIDFGIFDVYNADFLNGREKNILLDFNVDGPIVEKF